MSCFGGRMLEYQNISIDRFDGINLKSTAFFLSHCHEDHTAGLKDDAFEERLKSRNDIFLYCSDVTQILLGASPKYQHLHKYIRVLPVDKPTVVPVPEADSAKTQDVTVTLLHAGHCPGSVMFLYEGTEGRVLYTGDFRWESDKISQISALHQDGRVKPIKSLYIDTTFCHPDSIYIPPRMECLSVVCSLVSEWLGKDDKNVVHIISKTNYGHEPLFKEVAEHTGHKVHVSLAKCKIYRQIYGLKDTFTQDPEKTRVHACHRERDSTSYGGLPCSDQPSRKHVMRILPSTMFFTMKMRLQQKDVVIFKNGLHRVCYSFHSSLLEVRDLVTYLSPERVRPNVKPLPDKDLSMVQRRLNEFLKMKNSAKVRLEMDSQRPLGLLRPSKIHKPKPRNVSVSSDSEELDFGTQSFDAVRKIKNAKLTPGGAIKEQSSEDENSSYTGSQREDSEISDLCVDNDNGGDDDRLSTPPRSLLDAINSQEVDEETLEHRVCVSEGEEESFETALSLEQVQAMNESQNKEAEGRCQESKEEQILKYDNLHVTVAEGRCQENKEEHILKCDNLHVTVAEACKTERGDKDNKIDIKTSNQNDNTERSGRDIALGLENRNSMKDQRRNDESSYTHLDNCISDTENEISNKNCDDRSLNGSFDLFEDDVSKESKEQALTTNCAAESVKLNTEVNLSQGFVTSSGCGDFASQGFVVQNQDSQMEYVSDTMPVQSTSINYNENQTKILQQSKDDTSTRSYEEEKKGKKTSKLSAVDVLFESGESSSSDSENDVQIVEERSRSESKVEGQADINTFTDSQIDLIMDEPTQSLEDGEICDLTDQVDKERGSHSIEQLDLTISSGEVSYHGDHLDLTISSGETASKVDDHQDLDEEIEFTNGRNHKDLQISRNDCHLIGSRNDNIGNEIEVSITRCDTEGKSNHIEGVGVGKNYVCDSDSDATLPPTPLKHGISSVRTSASISNISELSQGHCNIAVSVSHINNDDSDSDATLPPTPLKHGNSSVSTSASISNISELSQGHSNMAVSDVRISNDDSDSDVTLPPTPLKNEHVSTVSSHRKEKQMNSSPNVKQTTIVQYLSPPKNEQSRITPCSPSSDSVCSPSILNRRKKRRNCWLNSGHKHIVIIDDDSNQRQKKAKRVIDLTQSDDDD